MITHTYTHTQPFNGRLSGTTRVGWYQKKLTHSHPSWPLDILYQLPPFTTIYSILCVQFTCLTIHFDNLSPGPLWSSSWSWTLCFILYAFSSPSHYLLLLQISRHHQTLPSYQLIPSAYSTKEPTPTTSPLSFLHTRHIHPSLRQYLH